MRQLIFSLIILFGFLALGNQTSKPKIIDVQVTEKGFIPNTINVQPDTTVVLKVTRTTDATCSTEILVPSKNIKKKLPLNKTVSVSLGKLNQGEVRFGCGMNLMDSGVVIVQ